MNRRESDSPQEKQKEVSRLKKAFETLEKPVFFVSITAIAAILLVLLAAPGQCAAAVNALLKTMTHEWGFLYIATHLVLVVFLIWLAFGRFGKVVLGDPDEKPEYNDFSWMAMMFCTGIASSLMIFSFLEPIYYLTDTPFGIQPLSDEAYEYAHMYGQFHWGPSAWLFYVPASIAIAYQLFVRKGESVRLGDVCNQVKLGRGWVARAIDVFTVFAVLGGIGTSMGLAAPLICQILSRTLGIPNDLKLLAGVLLLWFAIFSTSVYRGLDKGIKVLSNINIYLALLFIAFALVLSGIPRVLDVEMNSIGLYLDEFFRMSTYTDPFRQSGFPQNWTVFYWGWWLSYIPIMALFTARISRGRTIRKVILGMIGYGSLGCVLSFSVLGCYALDLQKSGRVGLVAILETQGKDAALIAILDTLPLPEVASVAFVVVCIVFMATTVDSSAYILASATTRRLSGNEQPPRWNRILWAVIFVALSFALTRIGGLETMQTASVLTGFPMIFICMLVLYVLYQMLRTDEAKKE